MNYLCHPNITYVYGGQFISDGEWIHPARTEITHEIIYVTSGQVYMNDNGNEVCANKGEMLILQAGLRHYGTKITTDTSFYWLHFTTNDGSFPFQTSFLPKFDSPHLFKELYHYAFLPEGTEVMINSILLRILAEIDYLSTTQDLNQTPDKIAEEIYEYLRMKSSAKTTALSVADHFGFCPDHISRVLKKRYGMGVKALTDRFILARAKEYLATTGKYVKEIAHELEFSSDKAFIGFFKYHEGMFPSKFREKFYKVHMNNK